MNEQTYTMTEHITILPLLSRVKIPGIFLFFEIIGNIEKISSHKREKVKCARKNIIRPFFLILKMSKYSIKSMLQEYIAPELFHYQS